MAEYLAREDSPVVADYLAKTPKLQADLINFYPELDINALLGVLREGTAENSETARDYLDRYLEIRIGNIPAGKLPSKVRQHATLDDTHDSIQKAKLSFDKAFQAVSRGSVAKAAFSVAGLMYHASSAPLSYMGLRKREQAIGAVLGASMATLTAMWPGGEPEKYADLDSIIQNSGHTTIEESVPVPQATEVLEDAETVYVLSINDDLSLTFEDEEAYERAKNYIDNVAYETYMDAPVSREIREAFVVADSLTPYPYEFWQGQAFAESTFQENALNESTRARGIMQMTPATTLEILYDMKDNPRYGFIPEAQLVRRTFDENRIASYSVLDGIDEQGLVASVAYDPLKAVMVAAEFNSKYFSRLQERYPELEMTSVHAYALHWQGYSGSQELFAANPETPAVDVYGARSGVVQNHKTIFYEDAKNATGERTVKEMMAYLESNRGLGNIAIPRLDEWEGSQTQISFSPVNVTALAEHYGESLAPLVSLIPKPRPDRAENESHVNAAAIMVRPTPRPTDL